MKREEYQTGCFCGLWNIIQLVTYKDRISIPQKLQIYTGHWYHMYIIHNLPDTTKSMIF